MVAVVSPRSTDAIVPPARRDDRYGSEAGGRVLMSGIQALVRSVLEQRRLDERRGLRTGAFVSGYPGSPLGGVDMELAGVLRSAPEPGVVHEPGLNEELAATAVSGTQLLGKLPGRRHDGVAGFWYGKNPGLDRAADAIRHANLLGTAPLGGAVAWIGDDPACKSSTLPSSSELMARSFGMPLLAPSTVEEVLTLGLHAVSLSRHAGVWVGLKIVADLADASSTVDLTAPDGWIPSPAGTRLFDPQPAVGPQAVELERSLFEVRLPAAMEYARRHGLNTVTPDGGDARLVVVAGGLAYATVLRALDLLGLDEDDRGRLGLRLVKLGMPWPLDPADVRVMTAGGEEVLVVEDKLPFVEELVKASLYGQASAPPVYGKVDPGGSALLPAHGAVDADSVARVLSRRLGLESAGRPAPPGARKLIPLDVRRTPYFCSGCPHNSSTRARDDQLVGAGIGCHAMVALDRKGKGRIVGISQMGGEGAHWIGLAPFTEDRHFTQNLGDGTFFHSGSLAIRAAVAAGAHMTFKLLYNDAVAMTGGQTAKGRAGVAEVTHLLAAEGVTRTVVCTPDPGSYRRARLHRSASVRHRDDLAAVADELAEDPGVTVVIYQDRCASEERRLRKRGELPVPAERVWINSRVCEGCGDCGEKSSCLSLTPVHTEWGTKMSVQQSSCNYDLSCTKGDCPSFVMVKPGRRVASAERKIPVELAEPTSRPPQSGAGALTIRMPGIGGTGVVTVSHILQTAAHLEGRPAAGLEQTGLAQKGGPVISDVRIGGAGSDRVDGSIKATDGAVDVLLIFDALAGAEDSVLRTADPQRTIAVVATGEMTAAAMVTRPGTRYPLAEALERIDTATLAGANLRVPAHQLAEALFGDTLPANLLLIGAAWQHGCIPLSADSIEEAIRGSGTKVDANLAAFRWGRAYAIDPVAVETAAALSGSSDSRTADESAAAAAVGRVIAAGFGSGLARIAGFGYADLVDYQNRRYAERYLSAVLDMARAESSRPGPSGLAVSEAYARQLHRLMAYKDEYEVARLHLDPAETARRRAEFGAGATAKVLLHPPILRAAGWDRKIAFGTTAPAVFRALRAARRLRGTPLDVFGRTDLRRLERSLPGLYTDLVGRGVARLEEGNADAVVRLAESAATIRGYEDVKLRNVERFRAETEEILGSL
jgi:indolepyruvate ferredoxin oxidoreductase